MLEQRKIADEVRIKIEVENSILKKKIISLQNEKVGEKDTITKNIIENEEKKFLELNLL